MVSNSESTASAQATYGELRDNHNGHSTYYYHCSIYDESGVVLARASLWVTVPEGLPQPPQQAEGSR